MEQIGKEIVCMLAKQLNKRPEGITPAARIKEDLGADSLDVVELLMSVEDKYGVRVPDEELMGIKTVGDLTNLVNKIASK